MLLVCIYQRLATCSACLGIDKSFLKIMGIDFCAMVVTTKEFWLCLANASLFL